MVTEYVLYSDERTMHSPGHKYLFLGGVIATRVGERRLLRALAAVRDQHNLKREVRWGKISPRYLEAYRAWVEAFFNDPYARCVVLQVDQSDPAWTALRPRADRAPTKDQRLAWVFHQFLLVAFGPLRDTKRWWVYPDAGLFSHDRVLDPVEFLFNRTYKRAFGPKTSRIIRLARSKDSTLYDLIQLADVLLGAISLVQLGAQPESPAKQAFLSYFRNRMASEPQTQRGLKKIVCQGWMPPEEFHYARLRSGSQWNEPDW